MSLHIITTSAFQHSSLTDCLEVAHPDDALLLIADGVHGVLLPLLQKASLATYVLLDDALARGMEDYGKCIPVDYQGMVKLTEDHSPIHTWQ